HLLDTTAFPSPVLLAELPSSVTDVQMLSGQTASLDPTSSPPTIDGAGIVRTDIVVTNGVIHLIDDVMIP
ncbi:MAG: fasciclin domain-containing protein, partial [Sandaracinaceae bacterium]|nr:fasciclin domain-containing protein [Sandaracinaceae bacterium]